MLICFENLIDSKTVAVFQNWLQTAWFEDGRATAGGHARLVKHNEQVSNSPDSRDPHLKEMRRLLEDQLWDHEAFMAAAQLSKIRPPIFSRYTAGMQYGNHMDNATMGDMRVDLSLTLFLSDPSEYDGGELVIDFATGSRAIKLSAGSGVLYATTAPHRVTAVTRGQRLAAVTWMRSLVRDPAAREILYDLKTAQNKLAEQLGKTPEIDLLGKSYTNLLRRWIED